LNNDILLDNLLSLLDKTLLKSLNLLEHLPSIRVSALKLPPSVVVEWVLQFLRQGLNRKTFSQELLVQINDLLAKFVNLLGLRLNNTELALQISNRVVENLDVLKTLLVLVLTLAQSGLQDLDLLVKKRQFIITSDELGTENISLVDHLGDNLLLLLVLIVGFLNDVSEFLLLLVQLLIVVRELGVLDLLVVHLFLGFIRLFL